MSPVSSTGILGSNFAYNSVNPAESGSSGQLIMSSTSASNFPERPDQPECRYFMNTGTCKYGSDCKYHHPKERIANSAVNSIGPLGLPSRPVSLSSIFHMLRYLTKNAFGLMSLAEEILDGHLSTQISLPVIIFLLTVN